jgi:hypothetical protein
MICKYTCRVREHNQEFGKVWVSSVRILSIFLGVFSSCGINKVDNNISYIMISSVLKKDYCTFYIDDQKYLYNKSISTNTSLGVDLNSNIKFTSDQDIVTFEIKFEGEILPDISNEKRMLSIDTIINLQKGNYFMITGRFSNIEILQSKQRIPLD